MKTLISQSRVFVGCTWDFVGFVLLWLSYLNEGDPKICGKVPPFLYSLFKCYTILTYNRAIHMKLIGFDNVLVVLVLYSRRLSDDV